MEEITSVVAITTKVANTMTDTIMVGNITTEDAKNITGVKHRSLQVIRHITRTIMAEVITAIMIGTDLPETIARWQTFFAKCP